ncbi:mycothiol system anti-sigma-R factor [Pengzhenrongella sicca]|uniref:mycothiol system anti-sigma-R factor n=1 Tax=Pengzhenrongella sicca TaxID=2819238 RepID=UPI001D0C363B|nr:mycothiol system anti-sigma-R factor [Pengzhenrongella sicca]
MSAEETEPALGGTDVGRSLECAEALERLSAFLDAEVDDADGDRIRAHLADCEPCLTEYDVEDHIKKLVRRSCRESAPVELHVRIRTQLTVLRTQYTAEQQQR